MSSADELVDQDGFYHVCFAVPDLEAAMDELTTMVGVRWGTPARGRMGPWPYSIVFTDRRPHFELIASVAGSPWEAPVPRFHHLGWWTSCVSDTADAWTGSGGSMSFDGREHGRRFVYVDAPQSGVRLEAVADSQRPSFVEQWARQRRP